MPTRVFYFKPLHKLMFGLALTSAVFPATSYSQNIDSSQNTADSSQNAATVSGNALHTFDVAAGPLEEALNRFAAAAGINLSYDPALLTGVRTQGVSGEFNTGEALQRLLAGSGMEAVAHQGGYRIQKATNSVKLKAVKVSAQAETDGITEGTKSYATTAVSVGGKTARDPREIQQSVSVVTAQRIRDQNLTTTEEALAQTTGITLVSFSMQSEIYSRGFAVTNMQYDGGSSASINNFWNSTHPDLAIFDHIEVLRGSDGLFAGSGEAGGTVNVVRKRPLAHEQVTFDVMAGSWDRYRVQSDVTGPIGWDGKLRGRFVAAQDQQHYFYELSKSAKTVLYGIAEADLSPTSLLTIGGSYEKRDLDSPFTYGLPRYSTGEDIKLPRETCLCTDWSYWNTSKAELFSRFEQSWNGWTLKLNFSHLDLDRDSQHASTMGAVDPITLAGSKMTAYHYKVPSTQELADITLSGNFAIFGKAQEFIIGGNHQDINAGEGDEKVFYSALPIDAVNFDPANYPLPATPRYPMFSFDGYEQKQSGIYASLRSEWTARLHSVIGTRYSNYSFNYAYDLNNQDTGALTKRYEFPMEIDATTPYVGLNFTATEALTVYTSYARIFSPQAYFVTVKGAPLKPITGDSYELGVKGAWLDGKLSASLATYQTRRENAGVRTSQTGTFGDLYCCYEAVAEIRSEGIDAEITGQLLPGWDLFAGYTYNTNEKLSGYGADNGKTNMPRTPEHLLKLWSMVQLGADWRVGGGINAQSRIYQTGNVPTFNASTGLFNGPATPFEFSQSGYVIASLRSEYQIDKHWSAALNINNIFDKTYYQSVGTSAYGNVYGEPRNWALSFNGRW